MQNKNDDEERICSKSPTIDVAVQRNLAETAKTMNPMLTQEEAKQILLVYAMAIDRILKENDLE